MRSKKNNHGRNHDCKRPDPRYKMNLYQRNNLFKRSFNNKIYIVSMGMNTSSRSTPTSPMHNLSFTSHVRWSCSVEILSGEAPEEYDSHLFRVHTNFRKGIGSTRRGILGTYTTNFRIKIYQLESRAWLTKADDRIYERHYMSGQNSQV